MDRDNLLLGLGIIAVGLGIRTILNSTGALDFMNNRNIVGIGFFDILVALLGEERAALFAKYIYGPVLVALGLFIICAVLFRKN